MTLERRAIAPAVTLAVLIVAALLLRLPALGNPLFDIDEQFYLLVGGRMLHGAVPYIDIWDRKPVGLFLLFAGIRALGGDGVVQYQLVAGIFAVATAATIAAIARRMTGAVGAAAGGILYLVWLNLLGGGGGQSPVFYNLAVAVAALATLRAIEAPERLRGPALAAMLAMGLAIQVKPTVVFEGALFGLAFLWLAWSRERRLPVALAGAMIAVALAPTVLAFGWYAAHGLGRAFWFANVTSILARATPPNAHPAEKLGGVLLVLLPLVATALAGLAARWRQGGSAVRFLACWLVVALVGFLAIKPYYNHYALPLLVPLCVASALFFARGLLALAVAAALAVAMLALSGYPGFGRTREAQARLAVLSEAISAHLHGGCLFVFQGPPILYEATHACLASRYVFPAHLNYLGEARAIGVDPAVEVRRLLATRPAVIVASRREAIVDPNPATWTLVEVALARDYRLVGTGRADYRMLGVYALKPR